MEGGVDSARVRGVVGYLFLKKLGRGLDLPGKLDHVLAHVDSRTLASVMYALDVKRNGQPSPEQLGRARYLLDEMADGDWIPPGWFLVDQRKTGTRRVLVFRHNLTDPADPAADLLTCARWMVS